MDSKITGELGENVAEKFLRDKGYRILDKNYSNRFASGPLRGEIDIIAKKGDVISFVEVKTLVGSSVPGRNFFFPEDKVNYQKQRKILRTAESWMMEHKIPFDSKRQIDVIAIVIDKVSQKARAEHFENI